MSELVDFFLVPGFPKTPVLHFEICPTTSSSRGEHNVKPCSSGKGVVRLTGIRPCYAGVIIAPYRKCSYDRSVIHLLCQVDSSCRVAVADHRSYYHPRLHAFTSFARTPASSITQVTTITSRAVDITRNLRPATLTITLINRLLQNTLLSYAIERHIRHHSFYWSCVSY
jgi:hypothetical protein